MLLKYITQDILQEFDYIKRHLLYRDVSITLSNLNVFLKFKFVSR